MGRKESPRTCRGAWTRCGVRLVLGVAGAFVGVVGCLGPQAHWSKSGVTDAERRHDSNDCLNEASYTKTVTIPHQWGEVRTREVDYDAYRQCMKTKGYREGDA
jgi:hypothetical protein